MSLPGDEEDEAFLLAVNAAEAAAIDFSKRRRLSTTFSTSSSPAPATLPAVAPEGPYLAALKGSHSSTWKQQQETLSYAHKRPGGSKTLASPAGGSGGAQVGKGACFKCGDSSHWARDCPQSVPASGGGGVGGGGAFGGIGCGGGGYVDAGGAVEEKACPCGAGSCLVLTSNTPRNPGRKFYRCPMRGGSSCGFFTWCDEQQPRTAAPLQASPQYQTDVTSSGRFSSKSSSACFKCGQENHWAKDCPNQSSDPYPDKGGRTFTSASSPDACFKCGKAGHWSRDCPTANCGSGTVTSHVKSSSTLGSWNSHRY